MTTTAQSAIDGAKLNAFVGRMLGDLGALTNAVLVHVGDQLGFYKALAKSGPTDLTALAQQTGTSERLVREWLSAQAAQGYVSYDKSAQKISLSPEQAMVLANAQSGGATDAAHRTGMARQPTRPSWTGSFFLSYR